MTKSENILMTVREMAMNGLDENIISEFIYEKYKSGKINDRMYELAIATLADLIDNYIL